MKSDPKTAAILFLAGTILAAAACVAVPLAGLRAAGDHEAGADVFDTYCSDCHSVSPKGTNRKGPTLYRVMGRRAGIVPGFEYSQGMVKSGIVWNPQMLNTYLENPRGMIPDGKMKKGLPKPADRSNVIAYLASPD
jgi:cytochrome c